MTSNLPILYAVDASVDITGAFMSLRSIAKMLKDRARIVLVIPNDSTVPVAAMNDFWKVVALPILAPSKDPMRMLRYIPSLLLSAWKLRTHMRHDKAERLLLNDFFLMHGSLLRLMGYRGHITNWVRCEPKRFAGPLAKPMLLLQRLSSNQLVTVSAFIHGLLPSSYTVTIIPNTYQGKTRTPRSWTKDEPKTIVYVGNYIAGKGQDVALEAFAIAAARNPTIRLDFYGSDMGLEKNRTFKDVLIARTKQLGLTERVSFHGFVPDTYPMLESAFAALNCSVSESFSRTVLEASGAGLPVIATASGGPQEILVEGKTGYLVPVGDHQAVAGCILKLSDNPELAAKLGQAGAAHIAQHFSQDVVRNQLLEVLKLA